MAHVPLRGRALFYNLRRSLVLVGWGLLGGLILDAGQAMAQDADPATPVSVRWARRLAPAEGFYGRPRWNHHDRNMRIAMSFNPEGERRVGLQIANVAADGKVNPLRDWKSCDPPGWVPGLQPGPMIGKMLKYVINDMCWLNSNQFLYSALTHPKLVECPGDTCGNYDIYKEASDAPTFYSQDAEMSLASAADVPLVAFIRKNARTTIIQVANPDLGQMRSVYQASSDLEEIQGVSLHPQGKFVCWSGRRVEIKRDNDGRGYRDLRDLDIMVLPLRLDPATQLPAEMRKNVQPEASSYDLDLQGSGEFLPAWDPTGANRYACYREAKIGESSAPRNDLIVVDLDDSGRIRSWTMLAEDVYVQETLLGPAWDPGGGRIYYIADDYTRDWPLMAVDLVADGGRTRQGQTYVVNSETINNQEVATSPNGKLLAVTSLPLEHPRSVFMVRMH